MFVRSKNSDGAAQFIAVYGVTVAQVSRDTGAAGPSFRGGISGACSEASCACVTGLYRNAIWFIAGVIARSKLMSWWAIRTDCAQHAAAFTLSEG